MYIGSSVTSWPSSSTRPESGAVRPTTIENVVVLPAPFAPSSPTTSPDSISTLTPRTTVRPLYDLVRSRVSSTDIQCDPGPVPHATASLFCPNVPLPLALPVLASLRNDTVGALVSLQFGGVSSYTIAGTPVIVYVSSFALYVRCLPKARRACCLETTFPSASARSSPPPCSAKYKSSLSDV